MASEVDYVVSVDWQIISNDFAFPKQIVFLDTLTLEIITTLTVGTKKPHTEHEWHIPKDYLFSFMSSVYFKAACLPTENGREPVLGTNDPVAWNVFLNEQMPLQWLGSIAHQPEIPIVLRAVHLANFVKEEKMIEWACQYLETTSKNEGKWKRVGNRLSSRD